MVQLSLEQDNLSVKVIQCFEDTIHRTLELCL